MYVSNLSFCGLPRSLYKTSLDSINNKDLCEVIRDAGKKAGVVIKTQPKKVLGQNRILFNDSNQITKEGAKLLEDEYKATNCRELRDSLAEAYKKYGSHDGILDQII